MSALPTLAVIGGTGALGGGLAKRWAKAGYAVILGSRDAAKAADAAKELPGAKGLSNVDAAKAGDIVVIAVPYSNHKAILAEIKDAVQGKVVVDTTVPLVPPKVGTVQIPDGSAAVQAQRLLGDGVKVVSACQNVSAHKLHKDAAIDCDVLVCGDDKDAREAVVGLIGALGMRGLHAGPIANSLAAEAMTSLLISINKRYKIDGAGIRITGEPASAGGA